MPELAEGTIARTQSIRVKLSPEMLKRVEGFSESYGMPVATLAAFALANWINQQETQQKMTRLAVLEATRQGFSQFTGEAMEKALTAALPAITVAMAKEGYTLDGEAATQQVAA